MKWFWLILAALLLTGCGGRKIPEREWKVAPLAPDVPADPETGEVRAAEPAPSAPPETVDKSPPYTAINMMWLVPEKHPCKKYVKPIFAAVARIYNEPVALARLNQWYQESRCDAHAKSPVGARGIGQVMPATQADLADRFGITFNAWDAAENIAAATRIAYNMRKPWNPNFRSWCERDALGTSGYNSGNGWWFKAQKACKAAGRQSCNGYMDIAEFVPQVNTGGARENLNYVRHIFRTWAEMQDERCPRFDATPFLP